MTERAGIAVLESTGPGAPPRRNGELVFDSPWQSRLFGVTMALHEAGRFEWEDFRRLLISAVATWERSGEPWSYYDCWLEAFEALLESKRLCSASEVRALIEQLGARPAGHDHRHDGDGGDHAHGHAHEHDEPG